MKSIFSVLCAISLCFVSCSSGDKKGGSASKGSDKTVSLRPFQEETLKNGLRILFIEDQSLPRVSVTTLVKSGSIDDPEGKYGLNSFVASLWDQGTKERSAQKIAGELEYLGASLSISGNREYTIVDGSSLSFNKNEFFEIYRDVLMNPIFSKNDFNRVKSQRLALLLKRVDNPSAYADLLYQRISFKNPQIQYPTSGTQTSLNNIRRSDVIRHYFKYFRPNNCIMAISGRFDDVFKMKVKMLLEEWGEKSVPPVDKLEPGALEAKMVVVHKPGLKQAQIRMGHLGIHRSHPDYIKLRLANTVLGGAFASRLNQKVRDDLGLTYSIFSSINTGKYYGDLRVSTFTKLESTSKTIHEALGVVKQFAEEGINQSELSAAKNLLKGQFPRALETVDGYAHNLLILRFYDVDDDYLKSFNKNVNKVKLADVNSVIKKYYAPDKMNVVIFTDKSSLGDQLKDMSNASVVDYSKLGL